MELLYFYTFGKQGKPIIIEQLRILNTTPTETKIKTERKRKILDIKT